MRFIYLLPPCSLKSLKHLSLGNLGITVTGKITMVVLVASLNKPMYMVRVIQDSRQITNFGMYMDGLRNAFIVFDAEFQSYCGG